MDVNDCIIRKLRPEKKGGPGAVAQLPGSDMAIATAPTATKVTNVVLDAEFTEFTASSWSVPALDLIWDSMDMASTARLEACIR
jgi:hypothetical protein